MDYPAGVNSSSSGRPGMFAYFGHVYQVSSQIDAGPMSIFGQVRSVIGEPGVLDVAVLAKSKGRR